MGKVLKNWYLMGSGDQIKIINISLLVNYIKIYIIDY